jgi:hypothetical protein
MPKVANKKNGERGRSSDGLLQLMKELIGKGADNGNGEQQEGGEWTSGQQANNFSSKSKK